MVKSSLKCRVKLKAEKNLVVWAAHSVGSLPE
jgi:hypothetical protein